MKTEKLIVGLIIVVIGLILFFISYQNLQPDSIEKGIDTINQFSKSIGGEKIPDFYKKDNTGDIILLIAGIGLTVYGLWLVLKSAPNNKNK